jgi:hypothetical protein
MLTGAGLSEAANADRTGLDRRGWSGLALGRGFDIPLLAEHEIDNKFSRDERRLLILGAGTLSKKPWTHKTNEQSPGF